MASVLANMGLVAWPSPEDRYNSAQMALNMQRIDNHDHSPGKGKPLTGASLLDGAVGEDKLSSSVADILGISQASAIRRGKSIIDTEESRTNTAFGYFATQDIVSGLVLPTDGLIAIVAQADIKESVANAATVGLFVGDTSIAEIDGLNTNGTTAAAYGGVKTTDWLAAGQGTGANGLHFTVSVPSNSTVNPLGIVVVSATAGTHSVSIRTKSSSGSVTARNRKLWAWTMGF